MALVTLEEKLRSIMARLVQAEQRADSAMLYAERTARLHHAAICTLHQELSGSYSWPAAGD